MEDLHQAVGAGIALIVIVLAATVTIFSIAGVWKMLEKGGQPGWGIFVPIYNAILLVRIVGLQDWFFLLFLVPGVNIVAHIIVSLELGKRFGRGAAFTMGIILVPALFYPVLGFGRAVYTPPPPPPRSDAAAAIEG
ncbi:MAG: DUF5684 domain-containing protein [Acidobacteria bacterium]|nr:DUF5684 domain-containing protein [Acidobacteriota bacterium]